MARLIYLAPSPKRVRWLRDSRLALQGLPPQVRQHVGRALWEAQLGQKSLSAKPLKGFGGAGVLEIVDFFGGNAYRAVYTVKFAGVIYVLLVFQKKSKKKVATPKNIVSLIHERLKLAAEDYEQWQAENQS
ncbi:MAG: type II toxin-antitoxin system RelE/ParE family toxin [Rhodospirillaceae bacterium]|nr:type II toxin-antitoxin system RelE/ParE family toxin [Rhodospirillaceae bacterium]